MVIKYGVNIPLPAFPWSQSNDGSGVVRSLSFYFPDIKKKARPIPIAAQAFEHTVDRNRSPIKEIKESETKTNPTILRGKKVRPKV